jgi:hypothetical protein
MPGLNRDLSRNFRQFHLLQLNTENTLAQVRNAGKFVLPLPEKSVEIVLQKHDLRAANYRAETTEPDGNRRQAEKTAEVRTFKGKVKGETNSQVRLSIDETKFEGYVSFAGKTYFIEAAQKYTPSAEAENIIVYESAALLQTVDSKCETALQSKMSRIAQKYFAPENLATMPPFRVHEIATEADFEYVSLLGGTTQANNEILDILNFVEGTYESDLNLTFAVTFQHAWNTPDPFAGNSSNFAFLSSFQNYWNANFPVSQYPRDGAHLWSNKPAFSGTNAQGIAFVGVICRSQNESYSLAGRRNEDFAFPLNYRLAAHEIGHTFNATHADTGEGCGDTLMNPIISNITPMTFCNISRGQIAGYVSQNNSCLAEQAPISPTGNDFDGDGKADVALFRPSNSLWYASKSSNGNILTTQWGTSTDKIVPADYNGDGKTDFAVFRAGFWYILNNGGSFEGYQWGATGDIPFPADFDADGKDDLAVFRNGTWFVRKSGGGTITQSWGSAGDIPTVADFDSDNKADFGVFRNGIWFILQSSAGAAAMQWGIAGDKPVAADYDGDGKADFAVFREGFWYFLNSQTGFQGAQWGQSGDIPAPADYDGDGKTDIAVFRSGTWFIQRTTAGVQVVSFGSPGDKPTANAFIP